VNNAQTGARVKIVSARVALGGVGLDEVRSAAEISLTPSGGIVSEAQIERCIREAEKRAAPKLVNRTVMHSIPLQYRVDGERVYGSPAGLQGTKLAVDTLLVTMLGKHHDDIVAAVEDAGIEVEGVMAAPIAASLITLTKAQKTAGVALANIGAETLSVIVFDDDTPVSVKVFPVGSSDITNTLALSFQLPLSEAEQKILDDAAVNVESWLAGKVADKFARVEGAGFTTGTGVGQPRGLFAYTTAATGDDSRSWGQFEHVVTGANGAFHTTKADPLQDLLGAFKDQYLQRASWLMRREVRTAIRKMKEATSDRYLWEPSLQMGQPDRLLGYPARVDQYVPAIATGSLSLAFGDIAEAYTIVDRMGIRTLRDPFTAKPYVVFYSTKRTGGGAVNFEAVKFLKFST
jgi:hypothetical protein